MILWIKSSKEPYLLFDKKVYNFVIYFFSYVGICYRDNLTVLKNNIKK